MRFSVIVPLYNKAPYVTKALRSILEQTFQDFELIVVDDGSTDDSLSIAKDVVKGTNATIISQSNAGVSTARNNGVSASHGDFLCFLDADDWWEPQFLEGMNELINSYSEAGLYGVSYYYVKNRERKVRLDIQTGYINYCYEYSKNPCMPIWTGAACVPRSIFNEFNGFKPNLKLGEDFDLWIRISLKYKVAFLNKPLSNYNQDVNVNNRLIGHLQRPEYHMLWNMEYLENEEKVNPDYKLLIDNLRVYALFPYFISKEYHATAQKQLAKVDWHQQPSIWQKLYKKPLGCLRCHAKLLHLGSICKKNIKYTIPELLHKIAAKKWEIGIVVNGIDEVMSSPAPKFRKIKHSYKDRWFADPFILDVTDKQIIILAEEYQYSERKGNIVLLKVNREDLILVERITLLEKIVNVSFPLIRRFGGEVFICPEDSQSNRWCQYKLDSKRNSLDRPQTIINESLVDAVMVKSGGTEMILATKVDNPNGRILSIWTSNGANSSFMETGHIMFSNDIARNGGDLFVWNGKTYRPAQHYDKKGRQDKVIIQEAVFNDDSVAFYNVKDLTAPKHKLYIGLHTINSYKEIAVVDLHSYRIPILGAVIVRFAHLIKRNDS